MVDHIVDASEPRGRVDIRVGVGRRRRWSGEAKGRIVAESYVPDAVVSGMLGEEQQVFDVSLSEDFCALANHTMRILNSN